MKIRTTLLLLLGSMFLLQSCATMLGGEITECQRHRPRYGAPRKIRAGAFIVDLFYTYGIGLIVDFSTGAIYQPCGQNQVRGVRHIHHICPPSSYIEIKHIDAPK